MQFHFFVTFDAKQNFYSDFKTILNLITTESHTAFKVQKYFGLYSTIPSRNKTMIQKMYDVHFQKIAQVKNNQKSILMDKNYQI
jgi:hypothetical protein